MRLSPIRNALLVFLPLSGYPLIAQNLKGTLRDATGAVLGRGQAVVVVQRWDTDAQRDEKPDMPVSVRPDSQGRCSISLSPGVYDVLVSCPICSPQVKQVKMNAGQDVQFNPQLKFSRFMKVVE